MKKRLPLILSTLFFLSSVAFITFYSDFRNPVPAQQVELSHGVQYGAVLKDFLFVQEITMQQRYLSRIDVYMAKLPAPYANSNVFVLIDDNQRILFTQRFSSADFGEALHFPFEFGKNFDIGKGRKVYACIYSIDGDQQSYIGLARKESGKIGKLYVMPILNNDVLQSFTGRQSVVDFTGTLGIRTYESDYSIFNPFRILLYLISLAIALVILFWGRISRWLLRARFVPEYTFAVIALFFGMIFMVITPPFQVPDEPAHFFRTWQITELNFFKTKDDFPASLKRLSDSCARMQFSTHEKTSLSEIIALAAIRPEPKVRTYVETPNYTFPYLPQAAGVALGRLAGLNPLWLIYAGRFANLLVAVVLIFLAIRTIPVFKWLLVVLGILPMTLYLFASLSYDAVTIGLSFLLLAKIFSIAFDDQHRLDRKSVLVLFLITLLLAASKPPYFLIVLTFLIIPVARAVNLRSYILVFAGLIVMSLLATQVWRPARELLMRLAVHESSVSPVAGGAIFQDIYPERPSRTANPLAGALPLLPHSAVGFQDHSGKQTDQEDQSNQNSGTTSQETGAAGQQMVNPINPVEQRNFIIGNPFEYIGILLETLSSSYNLYFVSFIGLFGWIDTQLPTGVAYLYFILICLLAMISGQEGIRLKNSHKILILTTFTGCFVLIETALYLYCNPVGAGKIIAVQGRYFIAFSPLLFLLFYNGKLNRWIHGIFGDNSQNRNLKKGKNRIAPEISDAAGQALQKIFPIAVVCFGLIALFWSVYLILDRFYVLTY